MNCYLKSIEYAKEYDTETGKIYLHSENIVIEEDGIILFHDGYGIPLRSLSCDNKGIYILIDRIQASCFAGHPTWCPVCGGCGVLWCPGHCSCF